MGEIIPVFTSHHTIGRSILTLDKDKKIDPNKPVSILTIAKTHGEEAVFVVDTDISGYWKLYQNSKALGVKAIFGLKLTMCSNLDSKEEDVEKTESNVIVAFKNSQAYYDFVSLYSMASTTGRRGHFRRLDWNTLRSRWTDNLLLFVPFYSSFIAKNLMELDHQSIPEFGKLNPVFFSENHDLPFDGIINEGIEKYTASEGYAIQPSHKVLYYKDADVMKHLTFQCMSKRKTWDKPELPHYSSDQFSYESYRRAAGKPI